MVPTFQKVVIPDGDIREVVGRYFGSSDPEWPRKWVAETTAAMLLLTVPLAAEAPGAGEHHSEQGLGGRLSFSNLLQLIDAGSVHSVDIYDEAGLLVATAKFDDGHTQRWLCISPEATATVMAEWQSQGV